MAGDCEAGPSRPKKSKTSEILSIKSKNFTEDELLTMLLESDSEKDDFDDSDESYVVSEEDISDDDLGNLKISSLIYDYF